MENLIIIKIYLNESASDAYHDLSIEEKENAIKSIKIALPSKDVRIVAFDNYGYDIEPFAEVEYTGNLSEKEKNACIQAVKDLSADGEFISNGKENELVEKTTVDLIKFHRIDDEIIRL